MSFAIGSSSDALATIQSLLQSVGNAAGNAAGVGPLGDWLASAGKGGTQAAGSAPAGQQQAFGLAPPPFKDGTMAALIALKSQDTNGTGSAQSLFTKLDTDGDGKVSQSELESALSPSGVDATSADALFAKLDRNGDGSIDQGELTSATRRGHGRHHHQMAAGGAGDTGGADSLLNGTGADGAKTQTATNADGSSTTTITYADGSTVTMTTPAAKAAAASPQAGPAASPVNMIEQLIKMQAQLIDKQGASVSAIA